MKTADKTRQRKTPARARPNIANDRQLIALAALMAGETRAASAAAAGVSGRTLDRWTATPAFTAEIEAVRRRAFTAALAVLKAGALQAARVLLALLRSKSESERRHAAAEILDVATKAHETGELEARILALEKMAGEITHRPGIGPN